MDHIPRPVRPTLTDPSAGSGPQDLGLRLRTSGGPTQINLSWQALVEAAGNLSRAGDVSRQQWQRLVDAGLTTAVNSPVPLHWRIPLFGVRLVGLTGRALAFNQFVEHGATAVTSAHHQYRTAEGTVQRLMHLGLTLAEAPLVLEHLADSEGDDQLAYNWGTSLVVLFGGAILTVGEFAILRRVDGLGPHLAVLKALADRHGLAAHEIGHHQLKLGEQIDEFSHTGDGTYTGYFEQMADVSSQGDLAVTKVTGDDGEQTYLVYLAGLDVDLTDINRDDGRGYLGLVDAAGNDSQELAEVVDEALEQAGAEPGDTIGLSGFSMGGMGVVNLAGNQALRDRYDLKAAATIGSPGMNRTIPPGTATVHFQERRDPVTHIFGEHHQESADRLTITYEHHNEDIDSDSPFGTGHDYSHHQEVIAEIENAPGEHLTEDEQALFDEFADLYEGEAETIIFDSGWEERDTPDPLAPGQEIFDGQTIDEIVEESLADVDEAAAPGPGPGMDRAETNEDTVREVAVGPEAGTDSPAAEAGAASAADTTPEASDSDGESDISGRPAPPIPTAEDPVSVAPGEVQPRSVAPGVIGPSSPAQPAQPDTVHTVPPRVIDPDALLRQQMHPETVTPAVIDPPVPGDPEDPGAPAVPEDQVIDVEMPVNRR